MLFISVKDTAFIISPTNNYFYFQIKYKAGYVMNKPLSLNIIKNLNFKILEDANAATLV